MDIHLHNSILLYKDHAHSAWKPQAGKLYETFGINIETALIFQMKIKNKEGAELHGIEYVRADVGTYGQGPA